ncbi:hypothetical protein ASZ90_017357 [hydrocarbon metagenome]|uniref:Uncharacterized protein n=1 Tax=hydrocarbon metagenome TaxID=938273 RepID=A0A0W8E9G9_9ZZZZ
MGLVVTIPQNVITYTENQKQKWINGEREDCPEGYCKNLPGSYGFGEYLVGQHFAAQGYNWIHHDFNIFGGNKPGKYPKAEEIFIEYFGSDRYETLRYFHRNFKPLEEPDLLIYKPDLSEIRFAESKRADTKDKMRPAQIKGLAIISVLLNCKAEIFWVVKEGDLVYPDPIQISFP